MTDEQIQELISTFLDARGRYIANGSTHELFLMVKQAVEVATAELKTSLRDADAYARAADRKMLFAVADERERILDVVSKRLGMSVATMLEYMPELTTPYLA